MKNQVDLQMTIIIWMTILISLGFLGIGLVVHHEASIASETLQEINESARIISNYAENRK